MASKPVTVSKSELSKSIEKIREITKEVMNLKEEHVIMVAKLKGGEYDYKILTAEEIRQAMGEEEEELLEDIICDGCSCITDECECEDEKE